MSSRGQGFVKFTVPSTTVMGIPKENFEIGLNQTRMDTVRWLIKKCEDYCKDYYIRGPFSNLISVMVFSSNIQLIRALF